MNSPKSTFRFVPTLTEVVRLGTGQIPSPPIVADMQPPHMPLVEAQLRSALQPLIQEYVGQFELRLREELEITIGRAMERALSDRAPPGD